MISLANKDRLGLYTALTQFKTPEGKWDLAKVIELGAPMPELRRVVGDSVLVKALIVLIEDLCGTFNVVRNMTPDQILDYCVEQVQEYPHYRFEDYVVFVQEAKRGAFGQPFDRIDRGVIDTWFEQYHARRKAALYERMDSHKAGIVFHPRNTVQQTESNPIDGVESVGWTLRILKDALKNKTGGSQEVPK